MANNRGGLQPTPEECKARDALEIHKDDVETRIAQLEKTLATRSPSKSMLLKGMENLERASTEFEAQYDWLHTIAGQGRLQDQVQADQDCSYHTTLQRCYLEVHA